MKRVGKGDLRVDSGGHIPKFGPKMGNLRLHSLVASTEQLGINFWPSLMRAKQESGQWQKRDSAAGLSESAGNIPAEIKYKAYDWMIK